MSGSGCPLGLDRADATENPRKYGRPPFRVAVVHGGPGAPGSMAPVARELSRELGVLEPLQSADSVDGEVEELNALLLAHTDLPVTLIGSSWGAMLGLLFAARHPDQVGKLILVGSGVFEESYAAGIQETRLGRLSREERLEAERLVQELQTDGGADPDKVLVRLGNLFARADAYDPLTPAMEMVDCQRRIYQRVWSEAEKLRRGGGFLEAARNVRCPVVAIHGDYDPHPVEGVERPLVDCLRDFRFIVLEKCGHVPWIERHARERFYAILRREVSNAV